MVLGRFGFRWVVGLVVGALLVVGCALVPMVNKAQQESQASKGLRDLRVPMVNKDLRVRRGLRVPMVNKDLRVPMVNKDLRVRRACGPTGPAGADGERRPAVRRGLRDPRAIPVTLRACGARGLRARRGPRVRADRLMVRHVRLLGALSGRWCRVSTPTVCWPLTA